MRFVMIKFVMNRKSSLADAVGYARVCVRHSGIASPAIIRCAVEYLGIFIANVAVFVHALAWYDDVDLGELARRLGLSMLMQFVVEAIADVGVFFIRARAHGLDFSTALRGGKAWMVGLIAVIVSGVLGIACVTIALMCRKIVLEVSFDR